MDQLIEEISSSELQAISEQIEHASETAATVCGTGLTGGQGDLHKIQEIIDSKLIEAEATYSLQALGLAFGKVFVESHDDYNWCMVEDKYGRDPAIRFKQTSILIFPLTIISKRIEKREIVDVQEMFAKLQATLDDLHAKNFY